ncbi:MAG: hypothetical protein LPK00_00025 [Bacillaceae bacterium]|nr:hypothetical protein [Bacillaceae bacterium]
MKPRYDDLEIDQSIQKLSRVGRNAELERKTFEIIKKEATKKQSRITFTRIILSPSFAAVLALVAIVSVGISNPNWLQGIYSIGDHDETETPNRTERIELVGKRYLEEQGYTVLYLSGREAYTLTEEMINTRPGTFKWSVQEFNPETYIGKLIEEEYYMITNHLFDSFQEETMVSVIMIDGKIMGGNAYIEIEKGLRGDHGFYSLDGTKKGE